MAMRRGSEYDIRAVCRVTSAKQVQVAQNQLETKDSGDGLSLDLEARTSHHSCESSSCSRQLRRMPLAGPQLERDSLQLQTNFILPLTERSSVSDHYLRALFECHATAWTGRT